MNRRDASFNSEHDRRPGFPMKLFTCQNCAQLIYFENVRCERCSHALGYLPESAILSALAEEGEAWRALAAAGQLWRFCANAACMGEPDAYPFVLSPAVIAKLGFVHDLVHRLPD
jgi:hypothetical protein